MIVHIVEPDQATKSGVKIGLCGAKVEGLYVRDRDGSRNSPSALCRKCIAARSQRSSAHPSNDRARP